MISRKVTGKKMKYAKKNYESNEIHEDLLKIVDETLPEETELL